ncbi:MAG: 50S ribosomal protein L28 [bacterium]|nr:50S ribosomal protein L28 [Myxococcales bacterium]
MSRRCELTGKGPIVGHNISHSHIKTKRRQSPNIHKRRLFSDTLGTFVTLSIAANTIRSIEHAGGFDKFILKQNEETLSKRALAVRNRITRARRAG